VHSQSAKHLVSHSTLSLPSILQERFLSTDVLPTAPISLTRQTFNYRREIDIEPNTRREGLRASISHRHALAKLAISDCCGKPLSRGAITGLPTATAGMPHTLPFLIVVLSLALHLAYGVVIVELIAIAYIRYQFMNTPLPRTISQVIVGGGIAFAIGIWLGKIGVG